MLRFVLNKLWLLLALVLVLIAVAVSLGRILLPELPRFRAELEAEASARLGVPVRIAELQAGWALAGPELRLRGISLGQAAPALRLAELDLAVDVWRSSLSGKPVARRLHARGLDAVVQREADGRWRVLGLPSGGEDTPLDTILDMLLAQRELSLSAGRVVLRRAGEADLPITLAELSLRHAGGGHALSGLASLEGAAGDSVRLELEAEGDPREPATTLRAYLESKGHWLPRLPLPRLEGYALSRAGVEGELWAERRAGRWGHARARLQARDIELQKEGPQGGAAGSETLRVTELGAQLGYERDGQGWTLALPALSLRLPEADWEPLALRLRFEDSGAKALGLDGLDLGKAAALGLSLPGLKPEWRKTLEALAPRGRVPKLLAQWQGQGEALRWQAAAELEGLSLSPYQSLPGVTGLTARVSADQDGGRAALRSLAGAELKGLFREPFQFGRFRAGLSWETRAQGWSLHIPGAALATEDAGFIAALDLVKQGEAAPEISLYGEMLEARSDHVGRYLPVGIMGAGLVKYLDGSIGAGGSLPYAHIALHGPLEHFPFDNAEGVFSIAARAENLPFRFQPDWPALAGMGADLAFEGDSMRIRADAGSLLGVKAREARAEILQLSADNPLLSIAAAAEGEGAAFSEVVAQSPLPALLGKDITALRLAGPAATELKLAIPLNSPEKLSLDGRLLFLGTALDIQPVGRLLTGLEGELRYSERAVSAAGVTGKLLGEPLRLDLAQGREKGRDYDRIQLTATARGLMSAKALQELGMPLAERLSGQSEYLAIMAITPRDDGTSSHRLSLASDLKGLKADFPAPVGLSGGGEMLSLEADLEADTVLRGRLGNALGAALRWRVNEQGQFVFDRASLSAGSGTPALPDRPGLFVTGAWPEAVAGPWVDFARSLVPAKTETGTPAAPAEPPLFQGLALELGKLELYGMPLSQAEVEITPSSEGLEIAIASKELAGRMLLPEDFRRQALILDLERAWLPAEESPANEPSAGTAVADVPGEDLDLPFQPEELPRLVLNCADCRYGARKLGALRLVTEPMVDEPEVHGLAIKDFTLRNASTELSLSGRWLGGAAERTELRGRMSSPDIGRFAADWQLAFSARESPVQADFELAWPGDPAQFALKNLDGFLNGRLGQGHLAEVSDQGARLFSLFSLQSLRRRLSLDFTDVFGKGFYYNSITGGFRIEDGVAVTERTFMDGLAAGVEIKGKTDLGRKTFDQSMRVSPKYGASLPALAGWAVEPTMALVALALNTVLQPALEVFTRIDYRVTGPWDKPVIEEVGKTKGKIQVEAPPPADAKPEPKAETKPETKP